MDDKCYYGRLFSTLGFKLPKTICSCINGFWLDSDYHPISIEKALESIGVAGKAFLKKSIESGGGSGVAFYDAHEGTDQLENIVGRLGKDIIVQAPICQSAVLARINESSVNTPCVVFVGKGRECQYPFKYPQNGDKRKQGR